MFNQIFESFLLQCFGLSLPELGPTLHYVVHFFGLPMTFELPTAAVSQNQDNLI